MGEQPTELLHTPHSTAGRPSGRRELPTFLRPPAVWFTGIAAGGIALIVAIILLTLPPPSPRSTDVRRSATPSATATGAPTATTTALPVFALPDFSDWRAAYLATDGKVHITSLDGQNDLTGPPLALDTSDTTNSTLTPPGGTTFQSFTSLAVSPNGAYLAYINVPPQPSGAGVAPPSGTLVLLNLTAHPAAPAWTEASVPLQVTHIGGWSPDSMQVAVDTVGSSGSAAVYVINPASPTPHLVPGTSGGGELNDTHVIGWLNTTHLLLLTGGNTFSFPPLPAATPTAMSAGIPTTSPMGSPTAKALPPAAWRPGTAARAASAATALQADSMPSRSRRTQPRLSAEGFGYLLTVDIGTGTAYTIAQISNGSQVALSPDGNQIVAANSCLNACIAPTMTTEVISTASGAVHALPLSDASIAPAGNFLWQPNANAIAATTVQSVHPPLQFAVSLVDAQRDSARSVGANAVAMAWSPDGSVLVLGDTSALSSGAAGTRLSLFAPVAGTSVNLPEPVVAFIGFVRTDQPA